MAMVKRIMVIEADQLKPVEEINNIIRAFLSLYPGGEKEILAAVRADLDKALEIFEEKKEEASA